MPKERPGRRTFLALQGAAWLVYCTFGAAYFGLRSPTTGAVLTALDLIVTAASAVVARSHLKDANVALSQATTLAWLIVALPSAVAQVLWNRDELHRVGPFARPARALVKQGKQGT